MHAAMLNEIISSGENRNLDMKNKRSLTYPKMKRLSQIVVSEILTAERYYEYAGVTQEVCSTDKKCFNTTFIFFHIC